MAVDELHANIGLRGAASRFCRQSVVASRVWAGSFTAMAEGGEGEDEIQFLRTVSKHYSASASLSPINAFRGRHAVQPINPSSRPPPHKKVAHGGGEVWRSWNVNSGFSFFPLVFRVCTSGVWVEVAAGLRGAPVDGTPDVRNLNETQPRRWCKGSNDSTPSPSPPPPPSTAALCLLPILPCVSARCGCMDGPPRGEEFQQVALARQPAPRSAVTILVVWRRLLTASLALALRGYAQCLSL